jgi:hypothetical protein
MKTEGAGMKDEQIKRAHADRNKQQGRRSDLLGVGNKSRLGNRGSDYWLRRLARDHQELFQRVAAGELSIHAACVRAGIRRKETRLEWVKRNWRQFPPEERNEFLKSILKR